MNSKRIEEMAIDTLKQSLHRCPFLGTFIDDNDKTPSWDGNVFVYKSKECRKSDWVGRVPVQVKGTTKIINGDKTSFSFEVSDIREKERWYGLDQTSGAVSGPIPVRMGVPYLRRAAGPLVPAEAGSGDGRNGGPDHRLQGQAGVGGPVSIPQGLFPPPVLPGQRRGGGGPIQGRG